MKTSETVKETSIKLHKIVVQLSGIFHIGIFVYMKNSDNKKKDITDGSTSLEEMRLQCNLAHAN